MPAMHCMQVQHDMHYMQAMQYRQDKRVMQYTGGVSCITYMQEHLAMQYMCPQSGKYCSVILFHVTAHCAPCANA